MPLALLLSPDDQAVSAITAVLEEMGVVCERPLDGISAAQKLHSHAFDLVLVDCENLPAAKLIFDVCRRGKGSNNPVPIAIVDGRAGLPTAFRLGAELILTKPVAKDQARSTVRTAVGRVKKEDPTRAANTPNPSALSLNAERANAAQTQPLPSEPVGLRIGQERAHAAAANSHLTSFSDPYAPATVSTTAFPTTVSPAPREIVPEVTPAPAARPSTKSAELRAPVARKPYDDPVLEELDRLEAESKTKPRQQGKDNQEQPTRSPLMAVLVLLVMCGGFYASWTFEPDFRTLAQAQIARILALVGMSPPAQHPAPATAPVKPAAKPAPGVAHAASADTTQPAAGPTTDPGVPAATGSTATPSTTTAATPAAVTPSATQAPAAAQSPATSAAVSSAATKPPALPSVKTAASPSTVNPNAVNQTSSKDTKTPAAAPADAELPGEKNAVILSSKGADKRLMHSVQPTYPNGALPAKTEGTMVLKAVVDENGNVTGARLIAGNAALANAAITAVKQWQYRPYVRDGKAEPFQTIVLVDFQRP